MNNYFIVDAKLPSLNEYINACRRNPFSGATFKKKVEKTIGHSIDTYKNQGILIPTEEPIMVSFTWSEKTQRRDVDNIASAKKYILDAMQNHGVIPNDNRKYVKGFQDEVIDGTEDYVIVEIKPANELSINKDKVLPGIIYL